MDIDHNDVLGSPGILIQILINLGAASSGYRRLMSGAIGYGFRYDDSGRDL
jgi:hypothetical protein